MASGRADLLASDKTTEVRDIRMALSLALRLPVLAGYLCFDPNVRSDPKYLHVKIST